MKDLKDGIRSKVHIDIKGHVHKHFRGTDADMRAANEARILRALEERGCVYVPRLLEFTPEENYIVTTNCGQPADGISRKKSDGLFAELERDFGVRHDDPEPRNVTYNLQLGRFCLIDFELAELLPEPTGAEPSPTGRAPEAGSAGVWKVNWASRTRRGSGHVANDDAFLSLQVRSSDTGVLEADGEALLDPDHLILAVSDGMGGRNAGEFASRLILSWIRRHAGKLYAALCNQADDPSPLEELLTNAHTGLNKLAVGEKNLTGMGATVTLAWICPGMLHLAHLGDSRLYLLREGKTIQLSHDHSFAWSQWHRGEIKEFQYRTHPRRSALYEVLGGGHANICPQLLSMPIHAGDRLLLCTDGAIDGLWERHIHEGLAVGASARDTAELLLARAVENDGKDDITLIVADLCRL